jgi:hypothetical protein
MTDPLYKTLEDILKKAKADGARVFHGYIADADGATVARWDRESGGWQEFIACAKACGANILYVDKTVFEQSQIDEAASIFSEEPSEEREGDEGNQSALRGIQEFETKIGLTCAIELAFVTNGVVHIYQETTGWMEAFEDLAGDDEQDDDGIDDRKPVDRTLVNEWGKMLASDQRYPTTRNHKYLLEQLSGDLFSTLPIYEILRRADTVFNAEFKVAADERLATEIQRLRSQGLNIDAIALKLGIPRGRVSGFMSLITNLKKTS